jgi:hypothetical protein
LVGQKVVKLVKPQRSGRRSISAAASVAVRANSAHGDRRDQRIDVVELAVDR